VSTRPVILGELGLLSLFDLAQLLALNRATGTLYVTSNHRQGCLQFDQGQLANARDERMQEGMDAACRVFGWRTGAFEFRVDSPVGGGRTIHDSTESVMLEAARRSSRAKRFVFASSGAFGPIEMAFVDEWLSTLQPETPGTTLALEGRWTRPPLERTPGNVALFEQAREHGRALVLDLAETSASGGSDGNLIAALGVPVLDGLGAEGDGAHALDEHVLLDSLAVRAQLLAALLREPGFRP